MPFIGASGFLDMLANFRVCWLQGRPGGGKTSLAIWIAQWMVEAHYVDQVACNFPLAGAACSPSEFPVPFKNLAVIFDEGGLFMDTWKVAKVYMAFTRKLNHVLLLPSFIAPHIKLCFFSVWRVQAYDRIRIPLWIYQWRLKMPGYSERGRFGLWHPERVFGLYPTKFMTADDGGIQDAVTAEIARGGVNVKNIVKVSDGNDMSEAAASFSWAVDEMTTVAEFADVGKKGRRR